MQRRTIISLVAVPLAVAATLIGVTPAMAAVAPSLAAAHGDSSDATPPGLVVGDGYVVVDPSTAVHTDGATFYPTGPISSDTLVVIPDASGQLPGGLTPDQFSAKIAALRASGAQSETISAPATAASAKAKLSPDSALVNNYAWGATSAGYSGPYQGDSVIGTDWSTYIPYNFDSLEGFNQLAVGLGRGHYMGYNGSSFGIWTVYYSLGSADSNGGGASVPWGNVADYMYFEGQCVTSTICGGYFWI